MTRARVLSPSKEITHPWIYTEGKGKGRYEDEQTYVGKWLVFVPHQNVDEVWERIRTATEKGRLGIATKVSTSRPSGYKSGSLGIAVANACSPPDVVYGNSSATTDRINEATRCHLSRQFPKSHKSTDHVICVYTYDFRDTDNVGETLKGLREIGITNKLYYKTDQATVSGVYSKEGPFTKKKQRASLYSSDDFEK